MQRSGAIYTIIFTVIVCAFCSVLVSGSAVGLKARQKANQVLDRQGKVLRVGGLVQPGERLSSQDIRDRFKNNIVAKVVTLATGDYNAQINPDTYDPRKALKDPNLSAPAPPNNAGIVSLAKNAVVYQVMKDGQVDGLVLPIEGKGLWSTLYGYLALEKDATTVRGIIFYEHGETPGLGGEIENPSWTALWRGRKALDANGKPQIKVIKGKAGPPDVDPDKVDGLSGATLTSRGVQRLVAFWLDESGFGPYLKKFRERGS